MRLTEAQIGALALLDRGCRQDIPAKVAKSLALAGLADRYQETEGRFTKRSWCRITEAGRRALSQAEGGAE